MKWTKGNEINGLCVGMWVYVVVFWTISDPEFIFPTRAMKLGEVRLGTENSGRIYAGCTAGWVGGSKGACGRERSDTPRASLRGLPRLLARTEQKDTKGGATKWSPEVPWREVTVSCRKHWPASQCAVSVPVFSLVQ